MVLLITRNTCIRNSEYPLWRTRINWISNWKDSNKSTNLSYASSGWCADRPSGSIQKLFRKAKLFSESLDY